MIVKLCMQLVVSFVQLLLSGISMLDLPDEALDVLADIYTALEQGAAVLAAYTHFDYLCALLSVVISLNVVLGTYHFIMWVLRKVPFLGVRE